MEEAELKQKGDIWMSVDKHRSKFVDKWMFRWGTKLKKIPIWTNYPCQWLLFAINVTLQLNWPGTSEYLMGCLANLRTGTVVHSIIGFHFFFFKLCKFEKVFLNSSFLFPKLVFACIIKWLKFDNGWFKQIVYKLKLIRTWKSFYSKIWIESTL